jgi:hypothetical protein
MILSVKGDATKRLSSLSRKYLIKRGSKIHFLGRDDSYVAVIYRNKVIFEEMSNSSAIEIDNSASETIKRLFSGITLEVASAGHKHGNHSSIKIDGHEYSQNQRGFNVVVLDSYLGVKETTSFDMWEKVYGGNE